MDSTKKIFITIAMIVFLIPHYAPAGEIISIATDHFPPYSYEENGTAKGIQIELAKVIFDKMNVRLEVPVLPWERAILMAESRKIDGLFGVRKTEERMRWLIFPEEPTFEVSTVIFKRKDDPFVYAGINSLQNKTIGVIGGYTYGDQFDKSNIFKRAKVANLKQNFLKLLAGRIDLVVSYQDVGDYILKDINLQNRIVACSVPVHKTPFYIAFARKPGHGKLSREFSRILKELKRSDQCPETMSKIGIPPHMIQCE
ncbi:ABC transporter substrate-binding protein [Desulfovibrio sp. JC022]|uniref:substrate-binding periplasmic protein n=1 Tax=Desulfovibrio sp. JC022 TaxID=2593642 RepID=UPI0013D3E7B1|nr:transporter substrate-binding domain-containing protein [Desulfovibrio sp. JC022]NDV23728.1 transporter substrate-binding domain-containing protein [Desulfovibrio sp. JC022]